MKDNRNVFLLRIIEQNYECGQRIEKYENGNYGISRELKKEEYCEIVYKIIFIFS